MSRMPMKRDPGRPDRNPRKGRGLAQVSAAEYSRDVDLIDLQQASTVMRIQVISTGERLYCSDEHACELFEDFVYSSYAHFNEERAGILRDIAQRGSVYG